MDGGAAVDRVLALDQVVLDLRHHEVGGLAGFRLDALQLRHLLGQRVRFLGKLARRFLVRLGVRHRGKSLDLAAQVLHLHVHFRDRSGLDAPVLVVGGEEEIEDLGFERVALRPRDVHHGGGAVVALKAGDQFLIVPALVLGVVGEPAFLDEAAP